MSAQPLTCTRCGQPVEVVEYVEIAVDYGPAMVDGNIVRPAREVDPYGGKQDSNSLRTVAVCLNSTCRNRWTLRRKFDPIPLES